MTIYYDSFEDMLDELLPTQGNTSVKVLDYGYQINVRQWFISVEVMI